MKIFKHQILILSLIGIARGHKITDEMKKKITREELEFFPPSITYWAFRYGYYSFYYSNPSVFDSLSCHNVLRHCYFYIALKRFVMCALKYF